MDLGYNFFFFPVSFFDYRASEVKDFNNTTDQMFVFSGAMSYLNRIMNVNKKVLWKTKCHFLLHGKKMLKNPTMVKPRSLHFWLMEVIGVQLSLGCMLFTKLPPPPKVCLFFKRGMIGRCLRSDWTVCIFNIWSIFYFAVLLFQSVLDFTWV